MTTNLDAHQKPPDSLRILFKKYQKASIASLETDEELVDFAHTEATRLSQSFTRLDTFTADAVARALHEYSQSNAGQNVTPANPEIEQHDDPFVEAYESIALPGLIILPRLVPLDTQELILSRTLHRDLSNEHHKTNVNFHHHLAYPHPGKSFFDHEQIHADLFAPKDPVTHKLLSTKQFLNKKLRWMTLGSQYDWTEKKYPDRTPPPFPADLAHLLQGLFPATRPEAAIVNLYSPGDVLSLHRDVSEFCDRGLISLSIGCDAIFLLGHETQSLDTVPKHLAVRLRSGDAVYMTGSSRYAWHGVPQVIPGTSPAEIQAWPASTEPGDCQSNRYEDWRNWMVSKRINLNVRQMHP